MVATVGQVNCSGLPATTPVFQSAYANSWGYVGRMTLNPGLTVPTITFTRSGGTLGASARMYSDGYKFVYVPPPPLPPSITTQPQSQTNNQGNNVTFSVVASGSAAAGLSMAVQRRRTSPAATAEQLHAEQHPAEPMPAATPWSSPTASARRTAPTRC